MKKFKRIVCLTLILAMALCGGARAAGEEAQASEYLASYLAYVNPDGNGKVSVWFEVRAIQTMDEVGAKIVRLYEQVPGTTGWNPVRVYRYTGTLNMMGYDDFYYSGHVDYEEATPGYLYMASVTVWAGDDGVGDSRVIPTASVTAK